jgi:hypothetical protein
VIWTLLATILIEGIVVLIYCAIQKKPAGLLFVASLPINLITQAILWLWLRISYPFYIPALLIAEILIWLVESLLLQKLSSGRLNRRDAAILSFYMNAASFSIGVFLPI